MAEGTSLLKKRIDSIPRVRIPLSPVGRSQVVRHRVLVPSFEGSNPSALVKENIFIDRQNRWSVSRSTSIPSKAVLEIHYTCMGRCPSGCVTRNKDVRYRLYVFRSKDHIHEAYVKKQVG